MQGAQIERSADFCQELGRLRVLARQRGPQEKLQLPCSSLLHLVDLFGGVASRVSDDVRAGN
jgi:hypothetical protein